MRVTRIGDHLAVEIPDDVAQSLGLREGDEIELSRVRRDDDAEARLRREQALERLSRANWKLPPDYKFDRDEANAR